MLSASLNKTFLSLALGDAGPNWEYVQSAQVPSLLASRSVLVCSPTWQADSRLHSSAGPLRRGAPLGAIGPIGLRCHYTKSNPIDDHSNISSKKLQKQNLKPLGHYTCMQCGTSHLQQVQEKITVTYHFSDLQEVYSGNLQIHTKCQFQYFHPPHISTSGKCNCVIIHQTTKATEYIG